MARSLCCGPSQGETEQCLLENSAARLQSRERHHAEFRWAGRFRRGAGRGSKLGRFVGIRTRGLRSRGDWFPAGTLSRVYSSRAAPRLLREENVSGGCRLGSGRVFTSFGASIHRSEGLTPTSWKISDRPEVSALERGRPLWRASEASIVRLSNLRFPGSPLAAEEGNS